MFDPSPLVAADFNGDGLTDLVVGSFFTPSLVVLLGNGDGTFLAPHAPTSRRLVQALAVGDFNGDGAYDLAVASLFGVDVLLGNGDGTFLASVSYSETGSRFVVVGDFNGDGAPDLAVTDYTLRPNNIHVFLGNGDGTFQSPYVLVSRGAVHLAAADMNGDGIQDLVTASPREVGVLLGVGGGAFLPPINYSAGGLPSDLVLADFNGDAYLDAAVTTSVGTVGLLFQRRLVPTAPGGAPRP